MRIIQSQPLCCIKILVSKIIVNQKKEKELSDSIRLFDFDKSTEINPNFIENEDQTDKALEQPKIYLNIVYNEKVVPPLRKDRDYERANEPLNLFCCTSKGSINLASIITPNIFVLSTNGIEESPNDRLRILLFKNKGLDLTVIILKRIACVFVQLITSLLFKSQVEIYLNPNFKI